MIQYKNISFSAKTFYGVEFKPGETKEVPGYINDPRMVRVFGSPKRTAKPVFKPISIINEPELPKFETRGRKKKSSEPEKDSVAENIDTKIETIKEETSNGNPS